MSARTRTGPVLLAAALLLGACASSDRPADSPEGAQEPSILKVPDEQVPDAVKAIEVQINRRGALVAEEVEIHCSRNYEWDISLTGDRVSPQQADGDEHVSIAEGNPRAVFRNLEIRAHRRIVFRKSGFGVAPFIRILARGRAAYAEQLQDDELKVRRARLIRIENAAITFEDEQSEVVPRDPGDRVGVRASGLQRD